jgi:hypothetical protein
MHMDKETKNILLAAAIGSIVGIGASMLLSGKEKMPLETIGKTIGELGEKIDKGCHQTKEYLHEAGKQTETHESSISAAVDLLAAGINLWNKIKKGM